MHVYTKPRGGQRAYKGHVITPLQDVQQLADILPRCLCELPVIIFRISGKGHYSKDFIVRRQKIADALYWLTCLNSNGQPNNPLYQNVKIDTEILASLPENGVLSHISTVDCEDSDSDIDILTDEIPFDSGPVNCDDAEKVFNSETEMTSFIPSNVDKKNEKDVIDSEFLQQPQTYN